MPIACRLGANTQVLYLIERIRPGLQLLGNDVFIERSGEAAWLVLGMKILLESA